MLKLLKQYQVLVNKILNDFFIENIDNPFIKEMSSYALIGGKRLRSAILLDIYLKTTKKLNYDNINKIKDANSNILNDIINDDLSKEICYFMVSVELLHNTSLILDDLPSMDNDVYRRDRETIHKRYGKSNANILASFFLEQSFYYIGISLDIKNRELDFILPYINHAKKMLMKEMMIATEGQNMDLNTNNIPMDDDLEYWDYYGNSKDNNLNLIGMKTAPFFAIAFCGGYLIARIEYCIRQYNHVDLSESECCVIMDRTQKRLNTIRHLSYDFSYGFQISDDILDVEKDKRDTELTVNYAINVGIKKANKKMVVSLYNWKKSLQQLSLWSDLMDELINYLPNRKK